MYLTEDEAKGKWCPQGRLQSSTFRSSYNIYPSQSIATLCITSECMMWRQHVKNTDTQHGREMLYKGYCGLAGKPE